MVTKRAKKSKEVKNLPVKSVSVRQSRKVKGGAEQATRYFSGISKRLVAGQR